MRGRCTEVNCKNLKKSLSFHLYHLLVVGIASLRAKREYKAKSWVV